MDQDKMDTGETERERQGSVASIGTSKRRRDDDSDEDSGVYARIQDLEEFIFNESNKVNKTAAKHGQLLERN